MAPNQTKQPHPTKQLMLSLLMHIGYFPASWRRPVRLYGRNTLTKLVSAFTAAAYLYYLDQANTSVQLAEKKDRHIKPSSRTRRRYKQAWLCREMIVGSMFVGNSGDLVTKHRQMNINPASTCCTMLRGNTKRLLDWQALLHPGYPILIFMRGLELLTFHAIDALFNPIDDSPYQDAPISTASIVIKSTLAIGVWLLGLPIRVIGLPIALMNQLTTSMREQSIAKYQQHFANATAPEVIVAPDPMPSNSDMIHKRLYLSLAAITTLALATASSYCLYQEWQHTAHWLHDKHSVSLATTWLGEHLSLAASFNYIDPMIIAVTGLTMLSFAMGLIRSAVNTKSNGYKLVRCDLASLSRQQRRARQTAKKQTDHEQQPRHALKDYGTGNPALGAPGK